ncbi:hypothetical protein ACTWPB_20540 [Nocardia sp. IBHARD005]|uniref:hypothetical protein n=1 Tax=Nocardia sp. IBHARD005 TaxID=3457765 RepID=UPI004059D992
MSTDRAVKVALVVLGVITMTPVLALVTPVALEYYGLTQLSPMETALLRHRGVMQGVLGAALVWAAFVPGVRVPVAVAAITTKTTNLVLTLSDTATRPAAPLFSTVFDTLAVLMPIGLVVFGLRPTRSSAAV